MKLLHKLIIVNCFIYYMCKQYITITDLKPLDNKFMLIAIRIAHLKLLILRCVYITFHHISAQYTDHLYCEIFRLVGVCLMDCQVRKITLKSHGLMWKNNVSVGN